MAYIVLQIGQCGIQLGKDLYNFLLEDLWQENPGINKKCNFNYVNDGIKRWFQETEAQFVLPRSILIDSETKVTTQSYSFPNKDNPWAFSHDNILHSNCGGSGNNWAIGYKEGGPKIFDEVLSTIQKELEKCDNVKSFIILSSTGGGTGSGSGSYITQHLKDNYSNNYFINGLVFPFSKGDITVQGLNTILTISKIYDCTDAIMVFPNDYFQKLDTGFIKSETSNFCTINDLIAEQIGSFLQPFNDKTFDVFDSLLHIAPHPSYKLLLGKSCPHLPKSSEKYETPYSWNFLLKDAKKQLLNEKENPSFTDSRFVPNIKSLSNLVICRGSKSEDAGSHILDHFLRSELYSKWTFNGDVCKSMFCERKFRGKERMVSVLSNNSAVTGHLDNALEKAWVAYTHHAFVHHYFKNGLEETELVKSISKCENLIKDYNDL